MPDWKKEIGDRLAALNLAPAREAEIIEELSQHLEDRCQELVLGGTTEAEACCLALDELCDRRPLADELARVERAVNQEPGVLGGRGGKHLAFDLWHDLRYSFRMLSKSPGIAALVMVSMALGVGINCAIFSLADFAFFRPLPVKDPGTLVIPYQNVGIVPSFTDFTYPNYKTIQKITDVFSDAAAYSNMTMTVGMDARKNLGFDRVLGAIVSGNYFDLLGVRPATGRTFLPEEDRIPEARPVAVISYRLWMRRFAGDAAISGSEIVVNDHHYTIIGVAPKEFTGTVIGETPDLWVPTMMQPAIFTFFKADLLRGINDADYSWLTVIGRLRPGISLQQAQDRVETAIYPKRPSRGEREVVRLATLQRMKVPLGVQGYLYDFTLLLFAVTGLVLLLACVNVANLLLQRACGREREIGIRLAIGAGRGRLLWQLLTESLMLSVSGGALGLMVAYWAMRILQILRPPVPIPVDLDLRLDWRVLGFGLLLSIATGVLFGLAPALHSVRLDISSIAAGYDHRAGARARAWRFDRLLMAVQVALTLVLVTWTGLTLASLRKAANTNLGFRHDLVLARVDLRNRQIPESRGLAIYQEWMDRVSALPGVESVSMMSYVPLSPAGSGTISGYDPRPRNVIQLDQHIVAPNFFKTMGIPILSGRDFGPQDTKDSQRVIISNEAMLRLGEKLNKENPRPAPRKSDIKTLGIALVGDSKKDRLDEAPYPMNYVPLSQNYSPRMTLVVHNIGDARALKAAIVRIMRDIDPTIPVLNVETMDEHLALPLWPARFVAGLVSLFGGLALVLATIGTYGVAAYAVARRTHEIGVRVAVGAQSSDIYRLVLGQNLKIALAGIIVGIIAAVFLARVVAGFLFGIDPTHPAIYAAAAFILLLMSLLAAIVPARRAAGLDPVSALRSE
jgi:predicted permease